jgi:hypothetical protein
MSCVFQNIDPPPPSPSGECVPPPRLCYGGRTHSPRVERGVGVKILEDARHRSVLYLYRILFGLHLQQFHPADRVEGQFLIRSKNPFYVLAGLGKAKSGGSQLATKIKGILFSVLMTLGIKKISGKMQNKFETFPQRV